MGAPPALALLQPGKIGGVEVRNRFIRAATAETLADENGFITQGYQDLYVNLARLGVGLLFTGHCYVHWRGKHRTGMTGLDRDDHVEPLRRLTEAVHAEGGRIFAEVSHTGIENRIPGVEPIAPSALHNPFAGKTARAATEEEIHEVIQAFGEAARRVRAAGFDGVHLHAAHGYLISQFLSPYSNRRADAWGGPLENRQRVLFAVLQAVRKAAGENYPITVKLGARDFAEGGLSLEEGLTVAANLDQAGVSAIEVSSGVTTDGTAGALKYAGLSRRRAFQDKLFHRVFARPKPEGYFLEEARRVRERVRCPVIAVGGLRSVETMEAVLVRGIADFVSLGRPLIREPDLVRQIEQGRRGLVDCTSCNLCAQHSGTHPLRCWRKTHKDLLLHAWHRFTGRLQ